MYNCFTFVRYHTTRAIGFLDVGLASKPRLDIILDRGDSPVALYGKRFLVVVYTVFAHWAYSVGSQ